MQCKVNLIWIASSFVGALMGTPVWGQFRWEVISEDQGALAYIGEQEGILTQGPLWDTDGQDNCGAGGDADARCEWITEHAGEVVHHRNGVLAAYLDGSIANQDIIVQDTDVWSDHLLSASTWLVNYDAHFFAVNAADMSNLRVMVEFRHDNITMLTLTLSGMTNMGRHQFRAAPQHVWTETPEMGGFWKLRVTLRRLAVGAPAMIWLDNIDIVEAGNVHYHEEFPIQHDSNNDGNVDVIDYASFRNCLSGEAEQYPLVECHLFDSDDDEDVDLRDVASFQRAFFSW